MKSVASGYTVCYLENSVFLLTICFKIAVQKSVLSPIKYNTEKNTTGNTKGLERGTKIIKGTLIQI